MLTPICRENMMKLNLDTTFTGILMVCAVVTTGTLIHREFSPFSNSSISTDNEKTVFINNWKTLSRAGIRMGSSNAPVQLIEFADFECPFCGDLHKKIRAAQERYPDKIALTFIHFPIPGHRFAPVAARAAECAANQGRFAPMHDQLFDGQDSFGLKSWTEYAAAAGVPDLKTFELCVKDTNAVARVETDRALGTRLGIKATPTLIINGWKLAKPPTLDELNSMVDRVLIGKSPL